MNKHIWIGIIAWGIFVISFALYTMHLTGMSDNFSVHAAQDEEIIFLLTGGVVTSFIGLIGFLFSFSRPPAPDLQQLAGSAGRYFSH